MLNSDKVLEGVSALDELPLVFIHSYTQIKSFSELQQDLYKTKDTVKRYSQNGITLIPTTPGPN